MTSLSLLAGRTVGFKMFSKKPVKYQSLSSPFDSSTTHKTYYQSPLILTKLFQHNLINVSYHTACYLYQVMMTLHFLNDVAYDALSTQKWKLRHNREFEECSTMGKLINRIPGSRLLISSSPGSALRTHVESLGKPRDVNKRSQSLAW